MVRLFRLAILAAFSFTLQASHFSLEVYWPITGNLSVDDFQVTGYVQGFTVVNPTEVFQVSGIIDPHTPLPDPLYNFTGADHFGFDFHLVGAGSEGSNFVFAGNMGSFYMSNSVLPERLVANFWTDVIPVTRADGSTELEWTGDVMANVHAPEPESFVMIGLGLAVLGWRRKW